MTDTKPVSVQVYNERAQLRKQAPYGLGRCWLNSLHPTLLPLLLQARDRTVMPTNGSHLLLAPLVRAAEQRGPAIMTDTMATLSSDTAEKPEPLELTDHIVDHVRTDP